MRRSTLYDTTKAIIFSTFPIPTLPVTDHAATAACAAILVTVRPRLNKYLWKMPEICTRGPNVYDAMDGGAWA